MKKRKILFDHQIFCAQEFGGISKYFTEIFKEFERNSNIKPLLSFKYHNNSYLKNLNSLSSVKVLGRFNIRGKNTFLNKMNYFLYDKTLEYDLYHPTYYDYDLIRKINRTYVVTVYDMIQERFSEINNGETRIIDQKKKTILGAEKIIAISEQTKNDIIDFYNIPKDKIQVIHLASKITKHNNINSLKFKKPYFLFVGNRTVYKNFDFMILSIYQILKKDYNLICVGGGKFTKKEALLFDKLGISRSIIRYDLNEDLLSTFYQNAVALIYPSKYEGFGLPLLEAFESKCPVICGNGGSLKEIGGEAPLYFEYDKIKSIGKCIESLTFDKKIREKAIKMGLIQHEKFSWHKTANETVKFYEDVLKKL